MQITVRAGMPSPTTAIRAARASGLLLEPTRAATRSGRAEVSIEDTIIICSSCPSLLIFS
ncbi:hypothetical protein ACM562_00505 [Streptomyces xantholiticus]